MADILNRQFASVFTSDNTSDLPDLGPSPYPPMSYITINNQGIAKLLKNLNPHKATGPDGIPAKILKETAAEILRVYALVPGFTQPRYCTVNMEESSGWPNFREG